MSAVGDAVREEYARLLGEGVSPDDAADEIDAEVARALGGVHGEGPHEAHGRALIAAREALWALCDAEAALHGSDRGTAAYWVGKFAATCVDTWREADGDARRA